MKTITLTDDEIRALLLNQETLTVPYVDEQAYERIGDITISAFEDATAQVQVSPHDLYDAECVGSLRVKDTSGTEVQLRVSKKGYDEPLAAPRGAYTSLPVRS